MALRECIDCGLEAHTEEDLEKFMKDAKSKHGRINLCKECLNKRLAWKRKTDDRYYLHEKYRNMKQRCYNPNIPAYSNYGGRGITICQEWLDSPDTFIDWALANGFKRELQIDRIDNDGSYNPDNCRWVTHQTQMKNRRSKVTDFDKGTRICSRCGIKKTFEEFHRNKAHSGGRHYVCKECTKETQGRR